MNFGKVIRGAIVTASAAAIAIAGCSHGITTHTVAYWVIVAAVIAIIFAS